MQYADAVRPVLKLDLLRVAMIFLKLKLFRDRDLLQESFIVIDVSIDK
jgi:hypothetical protein